MSRSRATTIVLAGLAAALMSCSAAPDTGEREATGGGGGAGGLNPLGRARCQAPPGVSASPKNTQEAVALLNALPKPTSVACFVESLARPLSIQATSSLFSQQPALSAASPRVFIKVDQLWLSVAMDGDGSYLIEFGDVLQADPPRSIKGELQLPISQAVAPSAPYDRVQFNQGTECGFCHYDERHVDDLPFASAFSSVSFRPRPDSYVSADSLRAQAALCDWQKEPHRCELLAAVFGGGDVVEAPFPATMATFF